MKRRFMAILLTGGLMLGLCGCGSGTSSTPGPSSAEEVAAPEGTETAEEIAREVEDEMVSAESDMSGYSVDKLVDLWSSGIITKQDIESKVANGEIGFDIYEEFLRCISDDKEFAAARSEEASNFWDYPELNNVTRDMVITDAISFSEGVAWITVADQPGTAANNRYIMLINASGEVLYFMKSETRDYEYTNFHNGVSLLSIDEDIFLVNTEGEVIWSIQDDGIKYFEEIYGSDSVESLYLSYGTGNSYTSREEFNGYFILKAKINTFEQTGDFITIIKPDVTPLFEPSRNVSANLNDGTCSISYEDRHLLINIYTGETIEISKYDSNEKIYKLWSKENRKILIDTLWYDSNLKGFTNDGENIAIDCSQYDFVRYPTSFLNGYCVLAIRNPDGAPYRTVIDENGNQISSPIKYPDAYRNLSWDSYGRGYVSENCFVLTDESSPLYYQAARTGNFGIYITLEGEVIDSGYDSVCPFSDGYSLVYKDNGYYRSYYFLNTAFDDAFPQARVGNADSLMGQSNQSNQITEKTYITMNNFSIEGKWKSVGNYGFGQAQPGAIVAFDGTNCNFFSPSDTYAFYADGDDYRLECTSFMSTGTAAFTVKIIDADHIDVYYGDNITELQRTE